MTPCFTKDNFVRVRVRVRVAGAKYAGKNVLGHDVLGQDDGNLEMFYNIPIKLFYKVCPFLTFLR